MQSKRGSGILPYNVKFMIVYLIVISIFLYFLYSRGSGAVVLEQSYAKNIALLIDSAKPITVIKLNMENAFDLAGKNGVKINEIVRIDGNNVIVKLSPSGSYKYSFFNNVDVTVYPDNPDSKGVYSDKLQKNYFININGYKK
jgi:hypothetical protein